MTKSFRQVAAGLAALMLLLAAAACGSSGSSGDTRPEPSPPSEASIAPELAPGEEAGAAAAPAPGAAPPPTPAPAESSPVPPPPAGGGRTGDELDDLDDILSSVGTTMAESANPATPSGDDGGGSGDGGDAGSNGSAEADGNARPAGATGSGGGDDVDDVYGIEGVEVVAVSGNEHVRHDVDYPTAPPAGGPHLGAWLNCGFYSVPVLDELAVHSLEHSAVWVTYRSDVPGGALDELAARAATETHLLVSPYQAQDSPLVLTAWGRQLRLDSLNDARFEPFLEVYLFDGPTAPEPGVTCAGAVGVPPDAPEAIPREA